MPSSEKYLLKSLAYYLIRLIFFFLSLSCVSSLYILDINPLSDRWFANIFFHFVSCLSVLLIVSLLCRSFLVWCRPTCLFLLLLLVLLVSYPNIHCQVQCKGAFSLWFLLEVLQFWVLCVSLCFELIFVSAVK